MISNKRLIKACYLGLAVLVIGSGGKPIFSNYVSALGKKPSEKITTTFSGEMDFTTNTETITVTASSTADNVTVTGIKLPDGNIVEGSNASYEVHENGNYNFTVLFEETNLDVNTFPPVNEEYPVPDSSVLLDSDTALKGPYFTTLSEEYLPEEDGSQTDTLPVPDNSTGLDTALESHGAELQSGMLSIAYATESNASPSIPESISPTEIPLFPEETDLPQATPPSADFPPFVTGSQIFTYTVHQLSNKNRTVVQNGYEFDKKTQTIIGYQGTTDMSSDLIIPVQVDGIDVLHIASGVFENKGITTVAFPKDAPDPANNSKVETIGERAFADNTDLYNVDFPNSLRSIGVAAFKDCKKLGIKGSKYVQITIPNSVTEIGEYAFANCTSLGKLKLSGGMETIKSYTFKNVGMKYLEIPDSVNAIEEAAFEDCFSIEFTILGKSNGEITGAPWGVRRATLIWEISRPDDEITDGAWVYSISQQAVIEYTGLGGINLTVPSSFIKDGNSYPVKKIGEMIFSERRGGPPIGLDITGITIPEGVTTIGAQAFGSCMNLQTVSLPTSLIYIGEKAFYLNQNLRSISFPDRLAYIGTGAFRESGLQGSIKIPGGVNRISDDAFYSTNLTGVEIAEGVTAIGEGTFGSCNIVNAVLPVSLIHVEKQAFSYMKSLKNITFSGVVNTIASDAFAGCSNMIINLQENDPGSVPDRPWGAASSDVKWKGGAVLPPPAPDPSKDWEFDRYREHSPDTWVMTEIL